LRVCVQQWQGDLDAVQQREQFKQDAIEVASFLHQVPPAPPAPALVNRAPTLSPGWSPAHPGDGAKLVCGMACRYAMA
jgi:hypothetical protein